jgi:hypothetical protein
MGVLFYPIRQPCSGCLSRKGEVIKIDDYDLNTQLKPVTIPAIQAVLIAIPGVQGIVAFDFVSWLLST